MNAGRLFMCVTATAAATAKRTNSAPLTAMDRMVAPIFSLILNVAQRLFRLRLVPALDLNLYRTRPQALGPEPEPDGEHHVYRGMRRLGCPGREPGSDGVDAGEHEGDRVPRRGLEGHVVLKLRATRPPAQDGWPPPPGEPYS